MGNNLTTPIEFAIKRTMKEFENSTDENDKFIYESLKRSDIVWDNISFYGIRDIGITYEQFCEQFKDKKHVVFLSDEEFEKYKRIIEELDKYSKIVNFIDELSRENRI